jgi:hypothetical protein
VIDQSAEAREAGLELRDTTLVIFSSPAARTAMALGGGAVSPRARTQFDADASALALMHRLRMPGCDTG